jgi:hypothetical protein
MIALARSYAVEFGLLLLEANLEIFIRLIGPLFVSAVVIKGFLAWNAVRWVFT